MSVYTPVTEEDLKTFLSHYELGILKAHQGILGGITNTNYSVVTTRGRYILTIYEVLKAKELPFYLEFILFLHQHHIPSAAPIARTDGNLLGMLHHKPATLFTYLEGAEVTQPNATQCFNVGKSLAGMHLVSRHFPGAMENPRYQSWWTEAAPRVMPHLDEAQKNLLKTEIAYLKAHLRADLPAGIIHADLFKDNVLMHGNDVAGFIDFYYAASGLFIYDLAIALNDWARKETGGTDPDLEEAMIKGYNSVRALTPAEKNYLPLARRAAALRFWLSRLLDLYFPPPGELTFKKNPKDFYQLLLFLRNEV